MRSRYDEAFAGHRPDRQPVGLVVEFQARRLLAAEALEAVAFQAEGPDVAHVGVELQVAGVGGVGPEAGIVGVFRGLVDLQLVHQPALEGAVQHGPVGQPGRVDGQVRAAEVNRVIAEIGVHVAARQSGAGPVDAALGAHPALVLGMVGAARPAHDQRVAGHDAHQLGQREENARMPVHDQQLVPFGLHRPGAGPRRSQHVVAVEAHREVQEDPQRLVVGALRARQQGVDHARPAGEGVLPVAVARQGRGGLRERQQVTLRTHAPLHHGARRLHHAVGHEGRQAAFGIERLQALGGRFQVGAPGPVEVVGEGLEEGVGFVGEGLLLGPGGTDQDAQHDQQQPGEEGAGSDHEGREAAR